MPKALHGTTHIFDYILALASVAHNERLGRITFDEIHRIIKKVAIATQTTREIQAGKKWKDYRKMALEKTFMRTAAKKTASAMVIWGFLKRPTPNERTAKTERWYYVRSELQDLGKELSQKRLRKARLMMFDHILQSERESAFTPDLMARIRDSKTKYQEELSEYNLPTEGVLAQTPNLIKNYLKVSQVDLTMITYWCQELNLLNIFNPRILDVRLPEEVYLTVWLASANELSSFYSRVVARDLEMRSFSDLNCAKLLEAMNAVRIENGDTIPLAGPQFDISENPFTLKSFDDPYASELIVIGEKPKFRGLVRGRLKEFEDTYLLCSRHISKDTFCEKLKKYYHTLRAKWKTPYVWISPLRALCCRALMVSDEDFDNMLTNLYKEKPEAIELSKAATGIFRTRVRLFEKPFKLYGQPFRMIRLVE